MARIGGALEIGQVAVDARVRTGQVIIAGSRGVAVHCKRRVEAGERESGGGVIKGRITPVGRAVALLASLREVGLHVARIRRALEIGHVARDAGRIRAGQVIVVIDVALGALQRSCARRSAGIRWSSDRSVAPVQAVVLWQCWQVCGKPDVTWFGLVVPLKSAQVAAEAGRVRAGQVVLVIDVALGALHASYASRSAETQWLSDRRSRRSTPSCYGTAGRSAGIPDVTWFGFGGALVIRQVAADAGRCWRWSGCNCC